MGNATLIRGTVAAQVAGTASIVDLADATQAVKIEGGQATGSLLVGGPELRLLESILETLEEIKLLIELQD